MPAFSSFKRLFPTIFLGVFLLFSVVGRAWADPHAVFYTATGQQQLFFNVLAALDQADYVEPAKSTTGTPAGQSREEILQKRDKAGFGAEQDSRIAATKTDLAGILTRSITLEGNDLWSAYLVHQFAIERTRTRNADELVRIYCERGLGKEGCSNTIKDPKKATKDLDKAFERDVVATTGNVLTRGLTSLLSGLPGQQKDAEETLKQSADSDEPELPLAYDPDIADWWQKALENDQNESKKGAAAAQVLNTMLSFFQDRVDPRIWDYVTFDSQRGAQFTIPSYVKDKTGQAGTNIHEASLDTLLHNQIALKSTAKASVGRVADQIKGTAVDGARPDLKLEPERLKNGSIGEVYSEVEFPAYAKAATTKAAIDAIPNTEQNRKYAVPESEYNPGDVDSVERGSANVAGAFDSTPNVLGTSTSSPESALTPAAAGKVLGDTSGGEGDDPTHHDAQSIGSPNENDTAFHHVKGAKLLLEAIGYKKSNGCGCSAQTATNHFGQLVISKINGAFTP